MIVLTLPRARRNEKDFDKVLQLDNMASKMTIIGQR